MKQTLLFFVLLAVVTSHAQAPYLTWNVTNQNANIANSLEAAGGLARTADGGYIMTGNTSGPQFSTFPQILNVRLDARGNILWQKQFGDVYSESVGKVQALADGGFINVATYTLSDNSADMVVYKSNSAGNNVWNFAYGNGGLLKNETGMDILELANGDLIACGSSGAVGGTVTNNFGSSDVWLLRLSATGSVIWSKSFGTAAAETGRAVTLAPDGNIVAAGTQGTSGYMVKVNAATGALIWSNAFPSNTGRTLLNGVEADGLGNLLFCGTTSATAGDMVGNHGVDDAFVLKTTEGGVKIWSKVYGSTKADAANALVVDADGSAVMNGTSSGSDGDLTANYSTSSDQWVFKVSSTGSLVWQKNYGSTLTESGADIIAAPGGGYLTATSINSTSTREDISCPNGYLWAGRLGGVEPAGVPSGAILWLKSDAGVAATGGIVSSWTDQSGFNLNALPVSGIGPPQVVAGQLGGLPVIRFSGANGLKTPATTGFTCKNKMDVFVIMKKAPGTTDQTILDTYSEPIGGYNSGFLLKSNVKSTTCTGCLNDDGFVAGLQFFGSKNYNATSNGYASGCFRILEARFNTTLAGDDAQLYIDGVRITRNGTDNSDIFGEFQNKPVSIGYSPGAGAASSFFTGDIAEIIIYPAILDGAARQSLNTYLETRYLLGNGLGATSIVAANTTANIVSNDGAWKHPLQATQPLNAMLSLEDRCNELTAVAANVYVDPQPVYTAADGSVFMKRHYTTNATGTRKIRLYFSQAELDALAGTAGSTSNLVAVQYRGATEDGVYDPADATSLLTISNLVSGFLYGNRYVEFLQTGGGEFYLKVPGTLPVKLLSFGGRPCADGTCLTWSTTDETGTASFLLEKSTNGRVYTTATTVKAVGSGANTYNSSDKAVEGIVYYRLKMIDTDGKFSYSKVIRLAGGVSHMAITPNPVQQSFILQGATTPVQLTITDVNGRQLKALTAMQNQPIDASFLATGIYFIRLPNGQTLRLLKK